jgi:hypothetical protein
LSRVSSCVRVRPSVYCCRIAAITAADWFEEISHS